MTTQEIARLFHAKRSSKGKWFARCPLHGNDRVPSLYITERKDGSTGVYCFAQCDTALVLSSVGLSFGDLFPDSRKLSEWEIRQLEARRKAEEAEELRQRRRRSRLIEQSRIRTEDVYRIANLLSRDFDSDKLARQFHWALDRQREAERATMPFFHPAFIVEGSLIGMPLCNVRMVGKFYFAMRLPESAGENARKKFIPIFVEKS